MPSIFSLLKILFVPVLAAALNQAILLLVMGLQWQAESQNSILTNGDVARMAFVNQAAITLVLTLVVGLPFFRFCARRNWSGYSTWLVGWALVHCPVALLIFIGNGVTGMRWAQFLSLIFSVFIVSSLWWWLFYAERSGATARKA